MALAEVQQEFLRKLTFLRISSKTSQLGVLDLPGAIHPLPGHIDEDWQLTRQECKDNPTNIKPNIVDQLMLESIILSACIVVHESHT